MKVFYYDYYTDEGIDAEDARTADLAYVLDLFYNLTDEDDNFLGIAKNNQTLQFMFVEQDKWLAEVPYPNHINYQMYADYDECVKLIKDCFTVGEIIISPKMKKVDIMNETLDDVLKR